MKGSMCTYLALRCVLSYKIVVSLTAYMAYPRFDVLVLVDHWSVLLISFIITSYVIGYIDGSVQDYSNSIAKYSIALRHRYGVR